MATHLEYDPKQHQPTYMLFYDDQTGNGFRRIRTYEPRIFDVSKHASAILYLTNQAIEWKTNYPDKFALGRFEIVSHHSETSYHEECTRVCGA